jgi:RHS repeat-associated protein
VTSTFEDGGGSANVTYYYYSDTSEGNLSSYGDNTNFWPLRPRYISEANPNSSDGVKSTYFIALNANTNITCMVPGYGASPFAAGSLCTTNHYYPAGDPNATKLKSVENPDGTMALYYYASGPIYQTNTMLSGQPNSGHTDIVDGTKTITVLGSVGEVVLRQVYDVPSGVLTAQESYTYTDVLKRSYKVRFLDGTTNTVQYNCCGVGTTIDRDGVTTYYSYDDLKRQTAALQNEFSITTATTFDAVGNVRATKRIAGSTITLQQTAYDDAGRVRFQTNALNGVTSYAYSMDGSGHRVTTMTNSDGGTRIETYYLDGTLYQITGTAVHPVRYDYYGGTTETKLDTDGNPTSEWVKTFTDGLGRQTETQYADYSSSHSYYNGQGQLTNQVDPDSVMTLYQYNGKGELALTAINLNRDGNIDYNGDRITSTVSDVVTNHSVNVRRTRTYVWDTFGSDSSNLVSTIETSTDGLKSWQTVYRDDSTPVITSRESTTGSSRTTTAVAPDNSYTISVYSYGRLASVTRYDASPSQIGKTTYGYDAHGRQYTIADVRNGTTTYGYNNADQVISVTTPAPGTGGSAQTTTAAYNPMLQATNVVQPDGTSVTSEYALSGELKKTYGSRTYPVEYTFDYAGRMKTMKTWQDYTGNSGTATNTWNYDIYRGFLTSKTYQGGVSGPTYTYTSAGRLASRIWARGITTAYGYDNAGGLGTITYDDGITPNVVNNYDRLGRLSTNVCNDITTTFAYNTANELLSESYSGGILAGLAVTNSYDAYLRRMAVALNTQPSTLNQFGYDGASRLAGVTNGNYNATYAYLANSPLVSQITFKSNSVTRMTTSKQYDYLNRLTAISSSSSSPSSSFSYQYNNANQRTRATLVDGSYWIYTYDSLGQVTGGNRYWADGTPVAGQQFDYSFDDIGNRKQTLAGGDAVGSSLRLANYTNNLLNQITSRDVPGYVDIMGVSIATNTVTVNGTNAYRKGEYFRKELPTDNSSAALWTNIIVTATGQSSVTGNVLLAKSLEAFTYDGDGNLTSDGLWTNTWNAENRLIASECRVGVPTAGRMKEEWTYLPDGRWTQRIVSTNNGSGWVAVLTNRFVWDNKVLLAILDQTNGVDMSFVRGLDLSGKMQRAGGVGGLLAINFKTSGTHFAAFDGNANVAALVSGVDGTASANYEYDPFGQTLRITGTMGKLNPIRYSTQFADDVRGIVKYPYREYIPTIGGWNSRDPIAEKGGINLYCFVGNNPVNSIDPFGFATIFALPAEVIAEYEAGISIEQIAEDYGLVIEQVLQLIAGYEISKQVNEIIKNAQRLAKGKDPCELAKSALRQVRNGIESYEKVIQEHQGWINDPSSYPGGLNPDPANPQRAIDKWLKDIARAEGNIEKSKQAIKILEKLVDAACKCWYKPWTWFR